MGEPSDSIAGDLDTDLEPDRDRLLLDGLPDREARPGLPLPDLLAGDPADRGDRIEPAPADPAAGLPDADLAERAERAEPGLPEADRDPEGDLDRDRDREEAPALDPGDLGGPSWLASSGSDPASDPLTESST